MKRIWRMSILVLCILELIAGCDAGTNSTIVSFFSGGLARWCDIKDYGTIYFENKSSTNQDYYIYWDNEYIGMVKAGETFDDDSFIVKKGNHEVIFKFTSTNNNACAPQSVPVNQCDEITLSCSN